MRSSPPHPIGEVAQRRGDRIGIGEMQPAKRVLLAFAAGGLLVGAQCAAQPTASPWVGERHEAIPRAGVNGVAHRARALDLSEQLGPQSGNEVVVLLPVVGPQRDAVADGNVFVWVLMLARREREHQATCSVSRANAMWREARTSVYGMGAVEHGPVSAEASA